MADTRRRPLRGLWLVFVGCLAACDGSSRSAPTSTPTSTATGSIPVSTASLVPTASVSTVGATIPSSTMAVVPVSNPTSFSFVSANDGWVLDQAPCLRGRLCELALWATHDGGRSWDSIKPPAVILLESDFYRVRFATLSDGYLFGPSLWSTHDGGISWASVPFPHVGPNGAAAPRIEQLEISGGIATATVSTGDPEARYDVMTSPVDHDEWTARFRIPSPSAAPVSNTELAVHGANVFVVVNARTVAGNARFVGGRWQTWVTPCFGFGGAATVAASSSNDVVMLCVDGTYFGTPRVAIYASSDAGTTFTPTAVPPPATGGGCLASPTTASVIFFATTGASSSFVTTFDGGKTWQHVPTASPMASCVEMGFTTPTQGLAVMTDERGSHVEITRDGGRTWSSLPLRRS